MYYDVIEYLGDLKSLTRLELANFDSWAYDFRPIQDLPKLQELCIRSSPGLAADMLKESNKFTSLRRLQISGPFYDQETTDSEEEATRDISAPWPRIDDLVEYIYNLPQIEELSSNFRQLLRMMKRRSEARKRKIPTRLVYFT